MNKKTNDETKIKVLNDRIDACYPQVVFVCKDVFDALVKSRIPYTDSGISYKNGSLRLRTLSYERSHKQIRVFEMLHPARSPYPDDPYASTAVKKPALEA